MSDEGNGHNLTAPPLGSSLAAAVRSLPPLGFLLLSLALVFFLYQVVGGIVTVVIFTLSSQGAMRTGLSEGGINLFRWATMAGQVLFLLAPTLFLARVRRPEVANFFRVQPVPLKQVVPTILAVIALQQLLQGYLLLQEAIPSPFPEWIQRIISDARDAMDLLSSRIVSAHSPAELLVVVLVIAVTPAFCEELLFRGLVQRTFEETFRGVGAPVAAGILFGLFHLNPFSLVPLCALGVYFGWMVYRSQNISIAIVAHFVNNLVACLGAYFALDEAFLPVAPSAQPTPLLIAVNYGVSALVFVASTLYFIRTTIRLTQPRPPVDTHTVEDPDHGVL